MGDLVECLRIIGLGNIDTFTAIQALSPLLQTEKYVCLARPPSNKPMLLRGNEAISCQEIQNCRAFDFLKDFAYHQGKFAISALLPFLCMGMGFLPHNCLIHRLPEQLAQNWRQLLCTLFEEFTLTPSSPAALFGFRSVRISQIPPLELCLFFRKWRKLWG